MNERFFFRLKAASPSRLDPILAVVILLTWVVLVPRMVPDRSSDRGIFISVAARLLAGDTLYSGVDDNKEPLFYYLLAGELALGRWSEWATEVSLVAITAAASFIISLKLSSTWIAASTSFITVPMILTGSFYYPGLTELPGIALTLVAVAASVFELPALAGFCLGLLVFTKLIFVPIALLGVMGVSCLSPREQRFSSIMFIVVGSISSIAIIVLLLFTRNELRPFIETIRQNMAYSQGALIGPRVGLRSLARHVELIGGWNIVAPLLIGITLVVMNLSRQPNFNRIEVGISAAAILTFLGSLAVLAMTGLWDQHRQIIYIATILIVISLTPLLDASSKIARLWTLALVCLIGLGIDPSSLKLYRVAISRFRASYASLAQLSPETRRLLAISNSGAYARFGTNDDMGHAVGLAHWKLVCPEFHQYPFEPAVRLEKVFECASRAPTLIISPNIVPQGAPQWTWMPQIDWAAWNEFVTKVEQLAKTYSCDASSGLRICTRTSAERQ
jgi:hypothetical protein